MAQKIVPVTSSATLVHQPAVGETLTLFNQGPATVFVSNNSGVTTSTGFPLTVGSHVEWFKGANAGTAAAPVIIYGITASGNATLSLASGT